MASEGNRFALMWRSMSVLLYSRAGYAILVWSTREKPMHVTIITANETAEWDLDCWLEDQGFGDSRHELAAFIEDNLTNRGVAYLGETEIRFAT
jgi:hypothetical protein